MALRNKSVFWYGIEVTKYNSSIDFQTALAGPIFQATLTLGYYSITGFIAEIKKQLTAANSLVTYSISINRSAGTSPNLASANRLTIGSSSSYLNLLFTSGPRTASNAAAIMGFTSSDKTGATSYTGSSSIGFSIVPDYKGYTYLSPDMMHNAFGALSISATGIKEAVVWSIQKFFQVEFKYEPETKVETDWKPFLDWAIQQRLLEFTPDITVPATFYECTLESTSGDGKGLGYLLREMLPDFPFNYQTGVLKFRQKN